MLSRSLIVRPTKSTKNGLLLKKRLETTLADASQGQFLSYIGLGVFAGGVGSLVGMGGAFVALPFLTGYFRMTQNIAHGTSMAVVLATSLGASLSYAQRPGNDSDSIHNNDSKYSIFGVVVPEVIGSVHVLNAVCMAITSSIMVVFGARLSKRMPAAQLKLAMGSLMLLVAPMIPFQSFFKQPKQLNSDNESGTNTVDTKVDGTSLSALSQQYGEVARPLAVGVFSGTLAGIFGVGGGVVMVPTLCFFTDMDYQLSLGTSLASMLPTAFVGSITQYRQGMMNLRCAAPLAIGCLAGSYLGGRYGQKVEDQNLKYGFAGVMLVMGGRTIVQALRMLKK